jgi:hypothetical protein
MQMLIHSISWPATSAWLTAAVPVAVQFVLFLRWLHRRMRNDEITRAFVRDIATNHLPHIYNALQKIAAEQGITLDETPLVQFVDLNHRRHP